jgi:glycosyltransferase involved in cell wall biosynthesis
VRQEVIEYLGVEETRVVVVYEAAREFFRPVDTKATIETRQKLGIGNEFILNVGTIEPRKNIQVLVSAFEDLMRSMPGSSLQLVIVGGRGWLSSSVLSSIEKSPFRNRIVLTGYLQDEELRDLYSSCRLFVYPSLYEGFGLPPLEAMACGAPVIVSTAKALVEIGGDAAQYFEANDPGELTTLMIELLANDDLRSSLSESARERAAEFSWTKAAIITYEVYRRTIEKAANCP